MKSRAFRQPILIQKKSVYMEYLWEGWRDCCCYEVMPEDSLFYIPDGGRDFLWNMDKKELYCLDCTSQVAVIEWSGDRLFGIHVSPYYEFDCQQQEVRVWMLSDKKQVSFQERAVHCSRHFIQNVHMKEIHPLLRYAVGQIAESKGKITVEELAMEADYTSRRMQGLFQKQFGCGPKRLSQFMRLRYAVQYIVQEPGQSFAVLAEQMGYSDQSHFQREFKRFMGMTPKQFVVQYL